jgi:hypothetical protein
LSGAIAAPKPTQDEATQLTFARKQYDRADGRAKNSPADRLYEAV